MHRQVERYGGGYGERYAPLCPAPALGHALELCIASAADAINYAVDGLDKFNTEKEVAQYLRKAFVDKVRHATARRHGRSPATSVAEPPTPQSAAMHTPHTAALLPHWRQPRAKRARDRFLDAPLTLCHGRCALVPVGWCQGWRGAWRSLRLGALTVALADTPDPDLGPAALLTPTLALTSSSSSPAPSTRQYHGVWHCIVGRNFGSFVTNEAKHYIYFYQGQIAVCLFKTN